VGAAVPKDLEHLYLVGGVGRLGLRQLGVVDPLIDSPGLRSDQRAEQGLQEGFGKHPVNSSDDFDWTVAARAPAAGAPAQTHPAIRTAVAPAVQSDRLG
jgi:hypothetical protein